MLCKNIIKRTFLTAELLTKRKLWFVIKKNILSVVPVLTNIDHIEFCGQWPSSEKELFLKDMQILVNFVSDEEEKKLFEEVEPYMKRLRYEYDHWDDAIHGFRETERKHWYPYNRQILDKIKQIAFKNDVMPYVHVLDLAVEGIIKPHVDSTRYCGNIIAGLSLLSDSVMRLVRTDEEVYKQNKSNETTISKEYHHRTQPTEIDNIKKRHYANVLLPRKSLYIMSNTVRYNFTHEILGNTNSQFRGETIKKGRRLSIICRNDP